MKRDPIGKLAVLAVILGVVGLAWLSRNLDSPLLERGEDWPLVGPLARTLRERYLQPPPSEVVADEQSVGRETGSPPAAAPPRLKTEGRVWVRAGAELREQPESAASVVGRTETISRLPVLERSGDWFRVALGTQIAWVELPDYDDGPPPLGSEPDPPRPLPGRRADPVLVGQARDLMAGGGSPGSLGSYRLVTDARDAALLRLLDALAAGIETSYEARYGVEPIDRPRETILLFERERDYRALQAGFERLEGLPASGLVGRGLAAAFVGGRGQLEVAGTLAHELTHLLNRRALGPALPPWLDEGLAGDLAASRISDDGSLRPAQLGGSFRAIGQTRIWWGGLASLQELQRRLAAGAYFSLETVTSLDWQPFVAQDSSPNYAISAFWVRCLLDSPDLRPRLRAFLRGVARGESVSAETLRARLGRSWSQLDSELADWILAHSVPAEPSG